MNSRRTFFQQLLTPLLVLLGWPVWGKQKPETKPEGVVSFSAEDNIATGWRGN